MATGFEATDKATGECVRRYARLHDIGSTRKDPEGSRSDAVAVLPFASPDHVEDDFVSPEYAGEPPAAPGGDGPAFTSGQPQP